MKLKTYKCIGFLIATFFIGGLQAQKIDKKFNETFKVNKDVLLAINVSNADINVTTWNRNEVSVQAVITVDGLSKTEAKKFLKNWEFEALGNRSKVQINASANRFLHFGENDFKFDFDFENIVIPEINFDNIKIEIPEFEMPEINLDFNKIWKEIDEYDFDSNENDAAKTFTYQSKGKMKEIVIKSKKEWKKFKRSGEYDAMKNDLKITLKEAQHKIKNIDMKMINQQINKAKIQIQSIDKKKIEAQIRSAKMHYEKIDKVKIKESLAAAKASIEKMKRRMERSYRNGDDIIVIEEGKSKKKVKITRKITIKVPKNATFDLNTRHSKIKLPKGEISGKVSYGSFKSDEINGGNLDISYAPVTINSLNACALFLNNVTDASFASVINTTLTSNSSGVKIDKIFDNVNLTSKFGELLISEVVDNLKGFKLNLSFSDATVNLKNSKEKLNFVQVTKVENVKSKNIVLNGNFTVHNSKVKIKGNQSKITIKNQ